MIADVKLKRRILRENRVTEKENMGNEAGGEIIKEIIQENSPELKKMSFRCKRPSEHKGWQNALHNGNVQKKKRGIELRAMSGLVLGVQNER